MDRRNNVGGGDGDDQSEDGQLQSPYDDRYVLISSIEIDVNY